MIRPHGTGTIVVKFRTYASMLALCLAVAGCGGGAKKPDKHVKRIHFATAAVLAQQVNSQVQEEGKVLLVHRQAATELAESWVMGLEDSLDERFTLAVYGFEQLTEEAATSFQGDVPLAEGMENHPDAIVVISAIEVSPRKLAPLIKNGPVMYALEWPFVDAAEPLLRRGMIKAGIFDRDDRDHSPEAPRKASLEEVMEKRYVLATPDNYKDLVRK